ncbi:MAG TPA: cation:proton antiporter [Thermoleophilaceae bacterium]|nr:cation:proton antiporter [Thermoleophilaceae bacterium]
MPPTAPEAPAALGPSLPAIEPGFEVVDAFSLELLFVGAAMLLAIGALSRQHGHPFSASLFYLAVGLLAAVLINAFDVAWIEPIQDASVLEHLTELALIVALFGAGIKIERPLAYRPWRAVIVLILVVMPVTIALVALYGTLVMGLSIGAAVALGAILSPTDPVLAGDVGVGPPGEGRRGDARFNLSAEAGLNDGLASPFVLIGVFLLQEGGTGWIGQWIVADVLYAVGVATALGAAGGYGVAWLASRMRARGLLSAQLDGFLVVGAVLLVYGATNAIDTYGFLAVFASGIAFRRFEFAHGYNRRAHDGSEVATNFLELAVILLLGSVVTLAALDDPGLAGWLLAPLLLVVIRPAAVLTFLARSRMPAAERLFVGWLGVRGIATIYYVSFVLEQGVLPDGEARTVFWTVAVCVIASITVHGLTQTAAIRRLLG